jgi:hypothetical protein
LVGTVREEAIALPTMWFTVAYITKQTAWWDVEFRSDRTPRTSDELFRHLRSITYQAYRDHVRLMEFTVFDGEQEIWRGLV